MKEDRHFVTALHRGLEVLRTFSAENPELGTTEIAKRTNLSQSTVWRLCYTLQKAGYLCTGNDPEKLRVTPAVFQLGCSSISHGGLIEAAQPLIREIANRFEASVSIAMRSDLNMIIVARAAAHSMLQLNFQVGSMLRIEKSALGAAYTASVMDSEREEIYAALRAEQPDHWPSIYKHLEKSRQIYAKKGYVLNLRQYHPDVNALGLSIASPNGKRVLAINCGGASSVMSKEKLEGPVAEAMLMLKQRLSDMLPM